MSGVESTPRREDADVPGWGPLWFGVAGGQAAWAIALLVAYPTVQVACDAGMPILVHAVRWVAAVVAVAATVVGYRNWRVARAAGGFATRDKAVQRVAFMGFGGMLLSAVAVFLLFVEDLATWVIDPCLSG